MGWHLTIWSSKNRLHKINWTQWWSGDGETETCGEGIKKIIQSVDGAYDLIINPR